MSHDDLTPDLTPEQEDALFDAYMVAFHPGLVATAPPGPAAATSAPETAEDHEDALFDAYMVAHFPHAARR